MKRILCGVVFALVSMSIALGQAPAAAQTAANRVEQELIALDRAWGEAAQRGDMAALERIMASEYVSVGADGRTTTRAEDLADIRANAGTPSTVTATFDDYTVQAHGNFAVLTHRTRQTGTENGQPVNREGRTMHAFVRRNGRWQVVYSQTTPVMAQPAAQSAAGNAEQEIETLNNQWVEALTRRDAAALERIMADNYMATNADGSVMTRAQILENMRGPAASGMAFQSITAEDGRVQVLGDTAIFTGRVVSRGQSQGQAFTSTERMTITYVRRDGRWQPVALHATRVEPAGPAM